MASFITHALPQVRSAPLGTKPATRCGRKPRRRERNAPTLPTRPLPNLPALGAPTRLTPPTLPRPHEKAITQALRARRDVLVETSHEALHGGGAATTAANARERGEHALILLPTLEEARSAAMGIQGRVIVAGVWRHAAMNANSASGGVVVVGTAGSVAAGFLKDGHGRAWLGKVRVLCVVEIARVLRLGGARALTRVFKTVRPTRKTVVVRVGDGRRDAVADHARALGARLLRECHDVVACDSDGAVDGVQDTRTREIRVGTTTELFGEVVKLVKKGAEQDGCTLMIFACSRVAEAYASMVRALGYDIIDIQGRTTAGARERGLEKARTRGAVIFGSETSACCTLPEIGTVGLLGAWTGAEAERRRLGGRVVRLVSDVEACGMTWPEGDGVTDAATAALDEDVLRAARLGVDERARRAAYRALHTVYAGWRRRLGWTRPQVVQFVNGWASDLFGEVPAMRRDVAGRKHLLRNESVKVAE